jgi:hypothetical protein
VLGQGDAAMPAFYPASGATDGLAENVINVPVAPMWRKGHHAPKAKVPHGGGGGASSPRAPSGRLEWRAAFAQRVIPALRAFSPEVLLLSSGFDAAEGDVGNCKMDAHEKYQQGVDLTPADFEWMTEQVKQPSPVPLLAHPSAPPLSSHILSRSLVSHASLHPRRSCSPSPRSAAPARWSQSSKAATEIMSSASRRRPGGPSSARRSRRACSRT